MIPDHYKRFCDNPELEIFDCDYYPHQSCPNTCYLAKNFSDIVSGKIKRPEKGLNKKSFKD